MKTIDELKIGKIYEVFQNNKMIGVGLIIEVYIANFNRTGFDAELYVLNFKTNKAVSLSRYFYDCEFKPMKKSSLNLLYNAWEI